MPDYALDIVNLSKSFRRKSVGRGGYTTIKSALLGWMGQRRPEAASRRVNHVIKNLTLRIPKGSSVGIIGRNGAGKSTLLKLITGIYFPDNGHVSLNGRVSALIELGAGFHPDFSGRENVLLGGAVHGMSRTEIERKLPEIVEFAELQEVIDEPVRTYSSGMFMRLGFSLAIHTEPDVLIVDEVLAVGDAAFVAKCKDKISALRKSGITLLLVTHDLDAVERWCDEVLWLRGGMVEDRGEPRRVIDAYRQFLEKSEEDELIRQEQEALREEEVDQEQEEMADPEVSHAEPVKEAEKQRWGSREIEITEVKLLDSNGEDRRLFHPEDELTVEISYKVNDQKVVGDVVCGIGIHRADGLSIHGSNTHIEKVPLNFSTGRTVRYSVSRLGLLDGSYSIDVALHREDGYPFDYHRGARSFTVRSALAQVGVFLPPHKWAIGS